MRPTPAFLAACALALLAGRALGAPAITPPAPPAGVVAPGRIVVTTLPALPAGAEEFELLLVPDTGTPVRLCAEQRVGPRTVRWRMPAVAARHARLVLRAGDEREEWESAPSAPFALAALPAAELPRLLAGRSEAGFALESSAGAAGAGFDAAPAPPSLSPGAMALTAVEPTPPGLALPAERAVPRPDAEAHLAHGAPSPLVRTNTPAFRPLRN